MKKLALIVVLGFLSLFPIRIYASELTTEPITTEEVTTGPVVDNFLDEPLLENIAPKIQLVLQIFAFIYVVASTIIIFKQRIDTAVAKKREADANNQLTLEQKLREIQLSQVASVLEILNIVVQNSKINTADKLSVTEIVAATKTQTEEVLNLASQLTNLDKTDISGILASIGDIAGLVNTGIQAAKTGDISLLTKKTETEIGG